MGCVDFGRRIGQGLRLSLLLGAVAIAGLSGCGGGGGAETSPAELRDLLVPAASFPVSVQRRFAWEDPDHFVSQGLSLPESTYAYARQRV